MISFLDKSCKFTLHFMSSRKPKPYTPHMITLEEGPATLGERPVLLPVVDSPSEKSRLPVTLAQIFPQSSTILQSLENDSDDDLVPGLDTGSDTE